MKKLLTLILIAVLISCGTKKDEDSSGLLIGLLGAGSNGASNSQVPLNAKVNFGSSVALGKQVSGNTRSTGTSDRLVGINEAGETVEVVEGNLPGVAKIYSTKKDVYIRFTQPGSFIKTSEGLTRNTDQVSETVRCILTKVRKSDGRLLCVDPEISRFSLSEPVKFDKEENLYYLGETATNARRLRNEAKQDFFAENSNITIEDFYVSEKDKVVVNGRSSGNPWVRILEPRRSTTIPNTLDYNGVKTVFTDDNGNYVYIFNRKETYIHSIYGNTETSNMNITRTLVNGNLQKFYRDDQIEKVTNYTAYSKCREGGVISAYTVEHFDCITTQFMNDVDIVNFIDKERSSVSINYMVSQDSDSTLSNPLSRGNSRRSLYMMLPIAGGEHLFRYVPLLSNLATREVAVTWVSKVVSNNNELLIAGRKGSNYVFYSFDPYSSSSTYPGFYNPPVRYLSDMNVEIFDITPLDKDRVILEGLDHDTNRNVVITLNLITGQRRTSFHIDRVTDINRL